MSSSSSHVNRVGSSSYSHRHQQFSDQEEITHGKRKSAIDNEAFEKNNTKKRIIDTDNESLESDSDSYEVRTATEKESNLISSDYESEDTDNSQPPSDLSDPIDLAKYVNALIHTRCNQSFPQEEVEKWFCSKRSNNKTNNIGQCKGCDRKQVRFTSFKPNITLSQIAQNYVATQNSLQTVASQTECNIPVELEQSESERAIDIYFDVQKYFDSKQYLNAINKCDQGLEIKCRNEKLNNNFLRYKIASLHQYAKSLAEKGLELSKRELEKEKLEEAEKAYDESIKCLKWIINHSPGKKKEEIWNMILQNIAMIAKICFNLKKYDDVICYYEDVLNGLNEQFKDKKKNFYYFNKLILYKSNLFKTIAMTGLKEDVKYKKAKELFDETFNYLLEVNKLVGNLDQKLFALECFCNEGLIFGNMLNLANRYAEAEKCFQVVKTCVVKSIALTNDENKKKLYDEHFVILLFKVADSLSKQEKNEEAKSNYLQARKAFYSLLEKQNTENEKSSSVNKIVPFIISSAVFFFKLQDFIALETMLNQDILMLNNKLKNEEKDKLFLAFHLNNHTMTLARVLYTLNKKQNATKLVEETYKVSKKLWEDNKDSANEINIKNCLANNCIYLADRYFENGEFQQAKEILRTGILLNCSHDDINIMLAETLTKTYVKIAENNTNAEEK